MKKKIGILGSTGSIGKTLIKILRKNKTKFQILLLTSNKNYKTLLQQANELEAENIIITDKACYYKALQINKNRKINIYNNFNHISKILKDKKLDYSMSSIMGLEGLMPTLKLIRFTKQIAIANKEALICGWSLIKFQLKKYKTEFLPVDSEHFSIWFALKNNNEYIKRIYLTASGGPFADLKLSKFEKITVNQALNHPNWKMGKKISIDSATMMNKVFEVIEAKNIFDLNYDKIKILIHPKSYIHGIVQFENGMCKIIAHDTNMEIPIFNTINDKKLNKISFKDLRIDILNNLSFQEADIKKFPLIKVLKILPRNHSLFETVLVSANDYIVNLFLHGKISYNEISKKLLEVINFKEFKRYKKIKPKKIKDITNLDRLVRLKIKTKSI